MFMRLYFRIMFFTSHYCLCSFIINYSTYLVFLSSSSYFRIESLKFLQQPFGFNRGRVSKPPGNTMNSAVLVPWIWFRDILKVGFCHGCDFHQMLTSDQIYPPLTGQKLSYFCFEGMRSHRIEMAYPIASAARCTPQFG